MDEDGVPQDNCDTVCNCLGHAEDCAGECGGDDIIDDCGVCGGLNGDQDGCGVCNGDGCSCGTPTCTTYCDGTNEHYNPAPQCTSPGIGGSCGGPCVGTWTQCDETDSYQNDLYCEGEGCDSIGEGGTCNPDLNCSGDNAPTCSQPTPDCNVADNTCYCNPEGHLDGDTDCEGTCNGIVEVDNCGECGGDNTTCCDNTCNCENDPAVPECNTTGTCICSGDTCGGICSTCDSYLGEADACGECGGDDSPDTCGVNCGDCDWISPDTGTGLDCNGNCGCDTGNLIEDECGVCDGPGACEGLDGSLGSVEEGECCSCDSSLIVDCTGECGGSAEYDDCGYCPSEGCVNGVWTSCNYIDCAGTCANDTGGKPSICSKLSPNQPPVSLAHVPAQSI
jgi:hypothetical protein